MKKNAIILFLFFTCLAFSSHAQLGKFKLGGNKKDSTQTKTESAQSDSTTTTKKKAKGGSNFMGKMLVKVAKVAGSAGGSAFGMVTTTDNLDEVVMMVGTMHNLRDKSVETADMTFFGDWLSGGTMTFFSFTQKSKTGFAKIKGEVTVDGKKTDGDNFGIYSDFSEANLKAVKKISIKSERGQQVSFAIPAPTQTFTLLSVNGQKGEPAVDFSKDVTLELALGEKVDPNVPIQVNITARVLGISTLYPIGFFAPATKIVIPAANFRNVGIDPSNDKLANYNNIYLELWRSEFVKPIDLIGTINISSVGVMYTDGRMINVTTAPNVFTGIKYKGTEKFKNGGMDYTFFKPNAFYSRPTSQIKKAGVLSLAIMGTTFKQGKSTSSSSSFSAGGTTYTTTTTTSTSASFPQVANEIWDEVLEGLYTDFTKIVEAELNTTFVPLATITNSEAYKTITPYAEEDENSTTEFQRSYKNTVVLQKTLPFSAMTGGTTEIMKATGVNALFKLLLDVKIAFDRGAPVMIPTLTIELLGMPNGDPTKGSQAMPTKYFEGEIVGDGVRYPASNTLSKVDLDKVIRKSNLLELFQRSLQELKAKELANPDYEKAWEASFYK
ncbi:MAG TPA: hypothetical protein PLJ60_15160 [Chryseolinea sp.]|nr:hypothetical protein [Chryseolinea sp.]HPM31672.1 hypothetical protein [Chryseolinea sp.]